MIILLIGAAILLLVLIYFGVCELKASVFPRIGFVNDEIPIGKIELNKHYSFVSVGGKKNEER
jgi:hypothetical protein